MTVTTTLRHSTCLKRLATASVIAGQLLTAAPRLAQDVAKAAVRASSRAAGDLQRTVAKQRIKVNRTVPKVTAPSLEVAFGIHVTTDALRRAHVFAEPLLPTAIPNEEDNRELGALLQTYATVPEDQRLVRLDQFLADRPASPWRASVLANAATSYARAGYFSRAAAYWEQAWELTKDATSGDAKTIADYSVGEALTQMVSFGQVERIEQRLKDIDARDVRGPAGTKVSAARIGLSVLTNHHELAMFSGPEALKMYLTVAPTETLEKSVRAIAAYHPSMAGTRIHELRDLAASAGLRLEVVHAAPVGEIPVPSVVHFRSQHYAAIVAMEGDTYVLRDPSLGGTLRLTGAALRDETSGYFLVAPEAAKRDGWRAVPDGEAANVVGHCAPGGASNYDPPEMCAGGGPGTPGGPPSGGGPSGASGSGARGPNGRDPFASTDVPPTACGAGGMPHYSFHPVSAALIIEDVPIGYTPPVGPSVAIKLSYNHRDGRQPQTMTYGNVGPLWTFDSLAYVTDNFYQTVPPYTEATVFLRGHGKEWYQSSSNTHSMSRAQLIKVSNDPPRYERHLTNGTIEVYALPDRAASLYNRQIFLTELIDPQGHSLTYTYDSSFRLVAITDAIGQVTTLEYLDTADALRLTKVTDPFNRVATITYDAFGRIESLTDVANLTSRFSYGNGDFIAAMITPYGTSSFRHYSSGAGIDSMQGVEATDPAGGTERLEFHFQHPSLAATDASAVVPTGFAASNSKLDQYLSIYWDKQAMATYPGDLTKGVITGWMMKDDIGGWHPTSRNIPHSIKWPLENRVWYRYPDQLSNSHHSLVWGRKPALIGRVLDGGASQIDAFTYNTKSQVTSRTDPAGRQTTFTYATNGIDLQEVRQITSGGTDLLASYADYNSQHLPGTITDASGQDTTLTYNAAGQPLTVTNAKAETTTLTYESGTGYLLGATGPVSGATVAYSYDGYGRVETVTGVDGYAVTYDYDALDRTTQVTYPDATTDSSTYSRLDLLQQTDRLGRMTRHFYDGYGRLIATRDPAGRTLSLIWCDCDQLDALVDANGNRTRWERDVQGRATREVRADDITDTLYTYDLAGRLKTVTDPKDQITTYSYNLDDTLQQVAFTNATIATPTISYTYDATYPRMLTMVDAVGTTAYSYKAAGTAGAFSLASVDGPFSSDTITYGYDALGRVTSRLLNGTGTAITYDALGRISQLGFPIGNFAYTFDGHTGRTATVTYPNSQTTTYSYLGHTGDHRLQTIHHKNPGAATLSKFDYTYDAVGNILTWRQERAGATTQLYTFGHDLADQLTSAVLTDTNSTPNVLKRQGWAYDPAGNRTVDQDDDAIFATSHDSLNRLQSRAPGGPITMAGTLNEAATVTIDGKPAEVDGSNNFNGTAQIGSGTTTVTLKAKDYSGNETTKQYEIDAAGSTTSYTYDANGNMTSDGTKAYFWNALNQLVEVKEGTTTLATFEYDGEGRRTEKAAGGVASTYIYDASDIVEERISGTSSDTIRYYHGAGIDEPLARKNSSDVVMYYLADHLGSVVQETNASGSVGLEREYDPWGQLVQGASHSGFAFTGREWDSEIGLAYHRARYYSPTLAAFLSSDPAGLADGPNPFIYTRNRSTTYVDPNGRSSVLAGALWGARVGSAAGPWGTVAGGVAGAIVGGLILAELFPNFWTESRPKGLPPEGVKPPVKNPDGVTEGPPSKTKPRERGDRHLWDEDGGEWRYHPEDTHHNPHWDHKDHARPKAPWERIPIGGKPPRKPGC